MNNSKPPAKDKPDSLTDGPETAVKRGNQLLPALLVAVVAALSGYWFATQSGQPDASIDSIQRQLGNTLVLPENFKVIPEFSLLDKENNAANRDLLEGQWSMLFFGFTHCPDVCPMTLSIVSDSLEKIAESGRSKPQVVFVSVDPKRDTPEKLKNYVEYFNPEFEALTGELDKIYDLTRPLNVVVSYSVDKDDPEQYTVDHTAAILLVDPDLRLRAKFNNPHLPDSIASDFGVLMDNLN